MCVLDVCAVCVTTDGWVFNVIMCRPIRNPLGIIVFVCLMIPLAKLCMEV